MKPDLKKTLRRFLNRMGWDVHRFRPSSDARAQLASILKRYDISLVLDVGANEGQYGSELRSIGYSGRILSFEPLSIAHRSLVQRAAGDPAWEIAPRCAIGASVGEITVNVAGNSVSSSVLPMTSTHAQAAAGSAYVGSETVPVSTLDATCRNVIKPSDRIFLKIDTQGFEWNVLNGAADVLNRADVLSVEASLVELYAGQHLWLDIVNRMALHGRDVWGIQPAFSDPHSGRLLQVDLIFVRADLPAQNRHS